MAKQTINSAPDGATAWSFDGVLYECGAEIEVTDEKAKALKAAGIVGKPEEPKAEEPKK